MLGPADMQFLVANLAATAITLVLYWVTRPKRIVISNRTQIRESVRLVALMITWAILMILFAGFIAAPAPSAEHPPASASHSAP